MKISKWIPVAAATIMGPYLLGVYRATQALPSQTSFSDLSTSPISVPLLPDKVDFCRIEGLTPYQTEGANITKADLKSILLDFGIHGSDLTKLAKIEDMPVMKFLDPLGCVFNEGNLEGDLRSRGVISPKRASEIVKELKDLGILDEYNCFNKTIDIAALFEDLEKPHLSTDRFFTMGTIGKEDFFTKKSENSEVLISKDESKEIWDKLKEKGLLDESGKVSKEISLLYQRVLVRGVFRSAFKEKDDIRDKIRASLPESVNRDPDVIDAVNNIIDQSVPVTFKYPDLVASSLKSMKRYVVTTKKNGDARISVAGAYRIFSTLDINKLSVGSKKIFNFFSELSKKCEDNEAWQGKKPVLDIRVGPAGSSNPINKFHIHKQDPFLPGAIEEETNYNLIVSQDNDAGTEFKTDGLGSSLVSEPNKVTIFDGNQPHRAVQKYNKEYPRILINAFLIQVSNIPKDVKNLFTLQV